LLWPFISFCPDHHPRQISEYEVSLLDVQAYERKFKDAEAFKTKAAEDSKPGAAEAATAKFEKAQVHFSRQSSR